MKKYFFIVLIISSCNSKKINNNEVLYPCNEICNIIDKKLYEVDTLSNGNTVIRPKLYSYDIYKVTCSNRIFTVSDSLKSIIEKSINKNNCLDIQIKKMNSGDTIHFDKRL